MKSRETLIRLRRFEVDEKRQKVADIEHMIADFNRMATDLERQIEMEQERAGVSDINHFAYPTFAKAAIQRRDNLQASIADLEETGRPLSDGPGPGRTDEEIQIVFDRYKATLYRIYNRELRKDPTLRGKILLRISIETNGSISLCKVESTDLASPELVAKIVARIKRFNFGAKEGVPVVTILYPIGFLPAG